MAGAGPAAGREAGQGRIVLVGGSGDLGRRIARALADGGADVLALVREGANTAPLMGAGASLRAIDFGDGRALGDAMRGAACVVSALNSLEDTIIDLQGRVVDAAIAAGVPRFIPSDYSLDFTKTKPGRNRISTSDVAL